jgi:hypothetical protein
VRNAEVEGTLRLRHAVTDTATIRDTDTAIIRDTVTDTAIIRDTVKDTAIIRDRHCDHS